MKIKLQDLEVESFITHPEKVRGGGESDGPFACDDQTLNIYICTGVPAPYGT